MKLPRKILFVDDDPEFLAAIQRTFRRQLEVEVAESGEEALTRIAEKGPYAVIVADLAMPGMGGAELLARVSHVSPKTVQVVLTGDEKIETFAESIERTNAFRYVVKSFDGEGLRQVLIDAVQEACRLEGPSE